MASFQDMRKYMLHNTTSRKKPKTVHSRKRSSTTNEESPTSPSLPPSIPDVTMDVTSSVHLEPDATSRPSGHTVAAFGTIQQRRHQIYAAVSKGSSDLGEEVPVVTERQLQTMDTRKFVSEIQKYFAVQPHDTVAPKEITEQLDFTPDVVIVRRSWEEKFMHEPTGSERPCCNWATKSCFASKIQNNGIVDPNFCLVEFYPEAVYQELEKGGWVWPEQTSPCILCLRAQIFSTFLQTRCNNTGVIRSISYATIGNIVDEPGEYRYEDTFVSKSNVYEGVLYPVVIPTVHDYRVTCVGGVRTLIQLLPRPEQCTSTNFFF